MNLVTQSQYARLCGVSVQAIYQRDIKLIEKTLPDGTKERYVDTKKYPPGRLRAPGAGRKRSRIS
jgi:hypothetical protein